MHSPVAGVFDPLMKSMLHGHGTLSGAIGKAAMVEFPHKQSILFGATSEVFIEEGEVPREVSMPSGTDGKVSIKKGETIPPLRGEVVGHEKGL